MWDPFPQVTFFTNLRPLLHYTELHLSEAIIKPDRAVVYITPLQSGKCCGENHSAFFVIRQVIRNVPYWQSKAVACCPMFTGGRHRPLGAPFPPWNEQEFWLGDCWDGPAEMRYWRMPLANFEINSIPSIKWTILTNTFRFFANWNSAQFQSLCNFGAQFMLWRSLKILAGGRAWPLPEHHWSKMKTTNPVRYGATC